jgi:uncharacterized protein YjbI with pentapeptide repeats
MPKGWAAQARSVRWLAAGIVAVVLGLAVIWVLFVPAADWLAHHDVGSATGALHETALDNARGRLLTLGASLFAAGALIFTARNFTLSREGQVTDRYTKAIEQLGSEKLDVCIGGIYALERVARDSARDHPTVMEVLAAFIREHSREQWPPLDSGGREPERSTRPDVQAAVTVVGRRNAKRDIARIDLTRANLTRADLTGANLRDAALFDADLTRADLTRVDLTHADLDGARLVRADLIDAVLTRAVLTRADLTDTRLDEADLDDADLRRARLARADLTRADLTDANLVSADLTRADLLGADLTHARLRYAVLTCADLDGARLVRADLTDADLTDADLKDARLTAADLRGARWPADAPVPEGWKLDAKSGRLERAGTDSGPTEGN